MDETRRVIPMAWPWRFMAMPRQRCGKSVESGENNRSKTRKKQMSNDDPISVEAAKNHRFTSLYFRFRLHTGGTPNIGPLSMPPRPPVIQGRPEMGLLGWSDSGRGGPSYINSMHTILLQPNP